MGPNVDIVLPIFRLPAPSTVKVEFPLTEKPPLNVDVPVTDNDADKVVDPDTPSVPPTVSFALTVRLLDRAAAPVTPSVPDIVSFPETVSFPVTVRPLIIVAFSVLGIMLAVSEQNTGGAGIAVQLANTEFAD